jgi:predicted RNase H-like HicB family nuclease
LNRAIKGAVFERPDDGTFAGRVPLCPGVVAFTGTFEACRQELRCVLEGWVLTGLKLGQRLPVLDGIDLHEEPRPEMLDTVEAARVRGKAASAWL